MPDLVLGIDESGTGALAGPFTVTGVILPPDAQLDGVRDSKTLTDRKRRQLCPVIRQQAVFIETAVVGVHRINAAGIREAWRQGIEQVIDSALVGYPELKDILIDGLPDSGLISKYRSRWGLKLRFEKKADARFIEVAAASVIAKTTRNDLMLSLEEDCPGYGFGVHAGYGTEAHYRAIECLGPSRHHRQGFRLTPREKKKIA